MRDRRFYAPRIKDYIPFEDVVMEKLCADTWGDGIGITFKQAAAVTSLPNNFAKNRSDITSFNEFQYFTKCIIVGQDAFNASSLTSIVFPQTITEIRANAFMDCHNLSFDFGNLPKSLTTIGMSAFNSCWATFGDVDLPNLSGANNNKLQARAFIWSGVSNLLNLGNVTKLGDELLTGCWNIHKVIIPATCTNLGYRLLKQVSSPEVILVFNGTTPPYFCKQLTNASTTATLKIYVPYSADHSILEAYQNTSDLASYAGVMHELNPDGTIPTE